MFNIFCRNRQQRGAERSIEALKVGLAVVDFEAQWDAEQVFRRGVQCAVAGDWQSATIYLYKAATDGYAAAQHYLGWCFEVGRGVERSATEAVRWYLLAAEQGNKYAQCCLAICYHKGRGVKRDYDLAARWYLTAAEQGVARAQYEIAGLYAEGRGVPVSVECSVRWYIAAAQSGHRMSQQLLRSFKVDY